MSENPPAFPLHPGIDATHPAWDWSCGMTLRDWFAGQWLAGALADHEYNPEPEELARSAYAAADAMLSTRSAPSPSVVEGGVK